MVEKVLLLQILAIILLKITHLQAQCNACYDVNHMACVSETTYQFCVNNVPAGAVNTCPTGYVCSTTNSPIICQRTDAGAVPTCNDCNRCSSNAVFACTGIDTYALCLGQTAPSTVTASCGANLVCNINSAQICESSATSSPTCPTAATATTATTASTSTVATATVPSTIPTYAQYFCSVMQMNRRFSVPREYDSTCKRYIYCFRTTAGIWSGQIFTCPGYTYFNPNSLYCVATRPTNC